MEVVANMLAPDVANRYFEGAGNRHPLGFAGVITGDKLDITDQWQRVQVTLEAAGAREFWIAPLKPSPNRKMDSSASIRARRFSPCGSRSSPALRSGPRH